MLDTDAKRRIDTRREIFVCKAPDPKSLVEQITIALIYKVMDDMDAERSCWKSMGSDLNEQKQQWGDRGEAKEGGKFREWRVRDLVPQKRTPRDLLS